MRCLLSIRCGICHADSEEVANLCSHLHRCFSKDATLAFALQDAVTSVSPPLEMAHTNAGTGTMFPADASSVAVLSMFSAGHRRRNEAPQLCTLRRRIYHFSAGQHLAPPHG